MTRSSEAAHGEVRGRNTRDARLADRLAAALDRPAAQQPEWPDPARARTVVELLRTAPPIVAEPETAQLSERLAAVARGQAFLLQSGDCAETFAETTASHLRANLGLLKRMSLLLARAAGLPVVPLARMAGQYAKPRSRSVDADGLPVYRGDMVNSAEPTLAARTCDPDRMLHAHEHAARAMTLARRAYAREQSNPRTGPSSYPHGTAGGRLVGTAEETGRDQGPRSEQIYVGHEMLLLDYECAPLRAAGLTTGPEPLLVSPLAHFLWIGERTRGLGDAHLAVAELLANPIGVKIGPSTTPEEAVEYVRRLDPHATPGRLTLISRMGRSQVREVLPPIVEKVTSTGHQVVWQCDAMHGNSRTTPDGRKTRHFDDIVAEIEGFFEVHRSLGTHPGGLHLEATGEDVTECLGGARGLGEADLPARYRTACDPRLNEEQSMELAFTVADLLAEAMRPAGTGSP
ncbi:3-deoxy-7-phosphoheptulonate synthase [Streptomyces asoensis]|uniref:Phospho-2-dehydro-3-deoxyheptonate aldolase n=2 Tax=Streptomyces asoensis TaxID=249586 RepID=A0ABQ3S641_9ACTN|nr:3-deoxy-7-phosphoheptulonate synthase [Streptomyces asoensis]GGQ98808.1 phospho-2-dehydro-3-deoxyheptonate aldolase [Streptomyces asoensis]GHI63480.1 phospho-2-dehydro-3-deoxyheptonate aldolase [Streptomyces asoensis]